MTSDHAPQQLHAELLRLADDLLAEVRAAREESAQLLEVLDQAVASAPAPADGAPGTPASEPASRPAGDADAVRAMVLEMARTGHSRDEVEAYVDEAFGLKVAADLLDGVFGPPSAGATGAR